MSAIDNTKIANRALQKVGSQRIAAGALLTEQSKSADEIRACFDMLRRAELRRNVWRFSIRNVALRAVDNDMQSITFATWASGTTYVINDVVVGSDSQIWISLKAGNVGNDPTATSGFWTLYFGPLTAIQFINTFSATFAYSINQYANGSNGTAYVSLISNNFGNDPTLPNPTWSAVTTYASGNAVTGSDNNAYQSKVGGNLNHNPVTDGGVNWLLLTPALDGATVWDVATNREAKNAYFAGELVYTLGASTLIFQSLTNQNTTNPLTDTMGNWRQFTAAPTISALNFIYPIGSGPESDATSRNVYILPNGFLREAPQEPKAGTNAFLGGPAGLLANDWNYENVYLTTFDPGPIMFRFAADIADPTLFDPLFVEGYACRLGMEVCEPLTQSTEKISGISAEYKRFMGEARTVNGIEVGPVNPPIDEYIAVRV